MSKLTTVVLLTTFMVLFVPMELSAQQDTTAVTQQAGQQATQAGQQATQQAQQGSVSMSGVSSVRTAPQSSITVTLKGKVIDKKTGEPLIGAQVSLKQIPEIGTVTDTQGEFTLSAPSDRALALVVKSLGYEDQDVVIRDPSESLTVGMSETSQMLKETVITGYFNRSQESFTGSAVTYTANELQSMGNRNVIESLKNLDPSFVLGDSYSLGSDPNQFNDITIRGSSSFAGLQGDYDGNPNEPLFILDGFETTKTAVFDLDMNRVAMVSILKDAAAKAIYGSKGANGVVVIETYAPVEGEIRVTYTGSVDLEIPDLSSYNLCNAAEKLRVELNAGRYTATSPTYQQALTEQYNALMRNVQEGVNTYWLSQPLRTGVGNKHTLYLEGGDPKFKYGITVMYNNIAGAMKDSDRTNLQGNIKLEYRSNKLLFRNSLTITANKAVNSPYGTFSDYASANPYYKPYDENGNLVKVLGYYIDPAYGSSPLYNYNPLYNAHIGTKSESKYTEIVENFYAEWQILESLKLTGRVGYTYNLNSSDIFYPGDHTSFATWTGDYYYKRGSYTTTDGHSQSLSVDVTLNYSKIWRDKHLLFVNGGYSLTNDKSDSRGMTAWGFLNNRVDHITFAKQYADNGVPTGSESISRSVSFIGALNYSFADRYLLDLSFRSNGSSVFGANNRWGTFWSAGIGWNIHKEKWFEDSEWLTQFKIRGTIGYTGSQNFSPYQAMTTYKFYTDIMYDNINGAYLMAMANDDLKWQQTRDINVGLDFSVLNALTIRFDGYISTTKDQLVDMTLPTSAGFSSYKENLGCVENKGVEATINWRIWRNPEKQAYVSINGSVAYNRNIIKHINSALKSYNDEQDEYADDNGLTSVITRYEEGQSMDAIWVVKSKGIDPSTGSELFVKKDGSLTYDWSSDDYIVGGDSNPKAQGNFGVSGEVKGFGFNCSFSYKLGGDYYNQTLVDKVENVDIAYNVDKRVLYDTWSTENPNAVYKRITSTANTTRPTSRFVEKNNELQLAAINVYYDFKFLNIEKIKLERLKLTLYMNDVCRISTVKTERGTSYPFARSCSFSLTATF